MKRRLFQISWLIIGITGFLSCGGEDDIDNSGGGSDDSISYAKKLAAFKDSLCSDVKFVSRKMKLTSYSFTPSYEIVRNQTSYIFNSDGTGVKKYIELTTTDQGFLASEEKFKWSLSGDNSYSLKIVSENSTSTLWSNVTIGPNHLTSDDGISLSKEKIFNTKTTDPNDIVGYSVTNMYTQIYSNEKIARGCFVSPCILTFYYKDGKVTRFIYSNLNARAAGMFSYTLGGEYTLKDGTIYLAIGYTGDEDLMWPMFGETKEKVSKYWIPIGTYKAETDGIIPIDNDVKYDFPYTNKNK